MIYFDNLQAYTTQSTHPVIEAIAGLLEAAKIHTVESRQRLYLMNDGATSGVWSRNGSVWTTTGAGAIASAVAEGGVVVNVVLPNGGEILFGDGDTHTPAYGIGVRRSGSDMLFVDEAGTSYLTTPYPAASDGAFRVVLHEVTNYKLQIEHKIIALYQGLRFVAAQAFIRENDVSTKLIYLKASVAGAFDLTVPEFASPAMAHSMDPGETPQASLNRVINGLTLKMLARYDTSVRVYGSTKGQLPLMVLNNYRNHSSVTREFNYDARYSRIRAVSAYPEAEYLDRAAADHVGGQFAIVSNPNVITMSGAAAEAERAQNESDSESETMTVEGPSVIILEPEDLVEISGGNWVAMEGDRRIGSDGSHISMVRFRKQVEAI